MISSIVKLNLKTFLIGKGFPFSKKKEGNSFNESHDPLEGGLGDG